MQDVTGAETELFTDTIKCQQGEYYMFVKVYLGDFDEITSF